MNGSTTTRLLLAVILSCLLPTLANAGDWLSGEYYGRIAGCGPCGETMTHAGLGGCLHCVSSKSLPGKLIQVGPPPMPMATPPTVDPAMLPNFAAPAAFQATDGEQTQAPRRVLRVVTQPLSFLKRR